MDKFDRIYALHNLLSDARHPVSRLRIEETLECKRGTIGRIISHMQDFLGAPIVYDSKRNGYYYDRKAGDRPYELPGLWFNTNELQALAVLSHLIGDMQPGLLEEQLRPFQNRIEQLISSKQLGQGYFKQAIRLLGMGVRSGGGYFQKVAEAVLQQKRINITYHTRDKDEITPRIISPQRIVRYRDNWYLDAYCHKRQALRNFAIDRIKALQFIDTPSDVIADDILDDYFGDAYGIFSGKGDKTAVLRFSAYRARWVAEETWHSQQQGQFLDDGSYELRIPYGKDHELIMDILKYGADVEVIAPQSLREAIAKQLTKAVGIYP